MIKFNRVNYFKFVLSLCFIVFFIFVIANADLFESKQEQLAINSSFVESDDGVSYEINLDTIPDNINLDDNDNIQYTVQYWDTLLKVAGVFWTTVSSIQKENNLKKNDLEVGQVLKVSNQVDGIVYAIEEKTNVVVFANTYKLNLQDLMTLNYVQDETEIFSPGQEVFINISKEQAYELWLLDRPEPVIIPKTSIVYRPTINKAGAVVPKTIKKTATIISADDEWDTSTSKGTIISKTTYNKNIKNGFYAWQCTWYAAIMRPDIFKYTDDTKTIQSRPFGGNANQWCAWAKKAGLRVWNTPSVGALIVYSRLRSSAGHVGKVIGMPSEWTIIVEDMNYKGKFVVTKRSESTDNKAISCYIY